MILAGCSQQDAANKAEKPKPAEKPGESVARVVEEIGICPAWTDAKDNLNQCLPLIAGEPTEILRSSIKEFMLEHQTNGTYSVDNMSKLFLLNRYIFVVSQHVKAEDARFFGGWNGVPHSAKEADLLWPFVTRADGRLELAPSFQGYAGEDFQAVEEFDYFNAHFPRRRFKLILWARGTNEMHSAGNGETVTRKCVSELKTRRA